MNGNNTKKTNKLDVLRLSISATCLALCMILPFLTGQIQQIGNMLCPMHLPAFLCGMLCGPVWGLAVGAVLPLLRSALRPTLGMSTKISSRLLMQSMIFEWDLPESEWFLYSRFSLTT